MESVLLALPGAFLPVLAKYTKHLAQVALELGALHVPIVPISLNDPVATSMLYIEILFEPEFVP